MERHASPLALGHLRVLELPGLAGAYCGKLLADLGADVIKVEPPAGDPARSIGPFAGDIPNPERSLYFINFNTNKRSAVIDLDTDEGRQQLRSLIPTVDVVIESFRPGYLASIGLGYDDLRAINPGIVLTSVTPFGQTGPYSQFQGNDLVANAMSGLLSLQGDPDMPPCNAPFDQGYELTSIHAAFSTLFALRERDANGGTGDHIDVSIQEVVGHMNYPVARYDLSMEILQRPGRGGVNPAVNAFPVQDGWVHLWPNRWDRLTEFLGIEELKKPEYNDRDYRQANANEIDDLIVEKTLEYTKAEIVDKAQAMGIPTGPVATTEDFVNSPHIQERGFFVEQDHPVLGNIKMAGAPYRLGVTPWTSRRPAPLLGQHTADVLAEAARPGLTAQERRAATPLVAFKPLKDIRILEIGTAFAGPFATRYLAELGAEVIKVESELFAMQRETTDGYFRTFPGGRSSLFMEINRSKRSITIDLHHARAQELARQIAAKSDIVLANFRPGALDNWNIGYKDLVKVNPAIIMVEMPGLGNWGPHARFISYGQTLTAYSGLMRLWGYEASSEDRRCKLAYPDWVGASKAATALLAALAYRDRTGQGQYIELAQVEAAGAMASVAHLDYFLNGRIAEPSGNMHVTFAPHNVYPCRGDDRWVAIGITDDRQWAALCTAIGASDLAADEGLATAAGRKAREAEIDERISQWTRQYTPHQAMRLLQKLGVPAGAVQNGEDLWLDPHLRERGYMAPVNQPFLGPVMQPGLTMHFRNAQVPGPRGAAYLGADNDYVYGGLLGLSAAEIAALKDERVLV